MNPGLAAKAPTRIGAPSSVRGHAAREAIDGTSFAAMSTQPLGEGQPLILRGPCMFGVKEFRQARLVWVLDECVLTGPLLRTAPQPMTREDVIQRVTWLRARNLRAAILHFALAVVVGAYGVSAGAGIDTGFRHDPLGIGAVLEGPLGPAGFLALGAVGALFFEGTRRIAALWGRLADGRLTAGAPERAVGS